MKRRKASPRPPSQLEETLRLHLMASGLWPRCVREFRFSDKRRWRFDFAFVHCKLAVECEGGGFVAGRHNRGTGQAADCEKYNDAVERGWRVLRYTMAQIKSGEAIQQIERILAHPPTITLPILPQRKPFISLEDLP